ncbi:hypothetical protein [Accumulibacter sp.]|nr:hypothetical protein [Accumulibacter sp.]
MHSLIDSQYDSIAVLDEHGVIISINQVWRTFAESYTEIGNKRL